MGRRDVDRLRSAGRAEVKGEQSFADTCAVFVAAIFLDMLRPLIFETAVAGRILASAEFSKHRPEET